MRITKNQENPRNYAMFVAVVCDRETYSEAGGSAGLSRQRAEQIVGQVRRRIDYTGNLGDELRLTLNSLEEMRAKGELWRKAAEDSLFSTLKNSFGQSEEQQ